MTISENAISLRQITNKNKKHQIVINKLEEIPGIGPKIKNKLLNYYANEEQAIKAVSLGAVGCVPDISFKLALKYAQEYFKMKEKISINETLVTKDTLDIYVNIINIISEYTKTEYSKLKLQQYFPLPSTKNSLIKERNEYFGRALNFVKKNYEILEDKNFSDLLKQLNTFKQTEDLSKIKSRIIITDSKKIEQQIINENLESLVNFEKIRLSKISNISDYFANLSKIFDVIIYCGDNSNRIPLFPNIIIVSSKEFSIKKLIPEKIIKVFAYNKDLIQTMIKIVFILKSLKENELIDDFLRSFQIKSISTLKKNISILNENGQILPGIDKTLDEYRDVAEEFISLISETETQINEHIKNEIKESSIEIQGNQILELIRSDISVDKVRNYIPPEVDILIEDSIHKHLGELSSKLKLSKYNNDLIDDLIPEIIEYPIELNQQKIDELEKIVSSRLNIHKYSVMLKIAENLEENYEYLLKLHQKLLEFDFFYSIGEFALDFNLSIPEMKSNLNGFQGKDMINLDLRYNEIFENETEYEIASEFEGADKFLEEGVPVPINYQLGEKDMKNSLKINSKLALLTGSNSGGKTMCIQTCAQAIILAQMGFPTLGNFSYYPFDEIYYYKKSSGQLTAGAFEITLLQFVKLAQSPKKKIIFADELESITEPNAASKVLAGIFSLILKNTNNFGIFVTHLAEFLLKDISENLRDKIRIDGIEATGLDKNLNLIVDRNPKYNFIAKSTPELILKRLSKTGSSQQKQFFSSILQKFKDFDD